MKDPIKMIGDARKQGIPTFTFKATDKHSVRVLVNYLLLIAKDENVSFDFELEIGDVLDDFTDWQNANAHKVKSPD